MKQLLKKQSPDIFTKIILFLIGIFIVAFTTAILVKYFRKPGIWISFILNLAFTFSGFYHAKPHSLHRSITWGSAFTLALMLVGYILSINLINTVLG